MGCCGDEDDDDSTLHQPLTTAADDHHTAITSAVDTISPMNSNFEALTCHDTLRVIFEKLPIADLARAACVCRIWYSVASDRDMITASFKAPWRLYDVVGNPSSGSFWRDNRLSKFAISHRICRGDSVASLAVKYDVQVMEVKRLNNMMSDHGIYSRERLLIPVSNADILINNTCYIELDLYAKREVAVLYLEGDQDRDSLSCSYSKVTSSEGKKRVFESIRRSMQVDDGTALYYLSVSNGDPRAALSEFSEDVKWERQAGLA
ncbi:F-box protein At1g55000 [Silene latifolia]|uniref:F-box protein At1g55000 n=1 Tax=Silene latifolia TaxID=37657 RepID=UPI003D77EA64